VLGVTAVGVALVGGLSSIASPRRIPRIGHLRYGPPEPLAGRVEVFGRVWPSFGSIEGQTIDIEWRFTPESVGRVRRTPRLSMLSRAGLRDAGWVEGQNVVIDERHYGDHPEGMPDLAAELLALQPDILVGTQVRSLAFMRAAADRIRCYTRSRRTGTDRELRSAGRQCDRHQPDGGRHAHAQTPRASPPTRTRIDAGGSRVHPRDPVVGERPP
jgi:hypothetical protein